MLICGKSLPSLGDFYVFGDRDRWERGVCRYGVGTEMDGRVWRQCSSLPFAKKRTARIADTKKKKKRRTKESKTYKILMYFLPLCALNS